MLRVRVRAVDCVLVAVWLVLRSCQIYCYFADNICVIIFKFWLRPADVNVDGANTYDVPEPGSRFSEPPTETSGEVPVRCEAKRIAPASAETVRPSSECSETIQSPLCGVPPK